MLTNTAPLYLAVVLIWGSSWLAIKYQLGVVDPMASVAYRFLLAAVLLLLWCRWRGLSLRHAPRDHAFMALQGALLFSLNYLVFYWATEVLTTGLLAVVFSTIVLMNLVNAAYMFGQPVSARVGLGAALGLGGIALVFWPELRAFGSGADAAAAWRGLGLSLLGTLLASLGNMASLRNQRAGISVLQSNAWGMSYGALISCLLCLLAGVEFAWDWRPAYGLSLAYLAVFASIFAFGAYLTLVGRIGAGRAAYATVLFPLVALGLSTLFEGYRWSPESFAGIALVLLGNLLVLAPQRRA